ncbi:hypothetical protein Tco_1002988 [Tanacetum coccineum]|uniref:Uncharacterized protein n=1 Tax=Tanacetum coccineum TaxID=301880 RepID=A0ABQ5F810_9ASTR
MLVPPVVVGEGSEQPPKPQPIPSTAPLEVLSQVTTDAASQPPKDPNTYRRTKRGRNTKVPQSGGSPNKVGDEAINEEMFDSVERDATTVSSLETEQASGGHTLGSGEDSIEHQIELTNNVPNTPHDSPLPGVNTPGSDEGSLKLNELMDLVTKLSHRVFDLEKVKTVQAKDIAGLKRRVTKLEQRQRSRILKNHPFRFGSSRRQSLEVLDTKKAVNTAGEGVSTASVSETVSTAAPRTPPTTTTVFDDEDVIMAMAQTLIKMKEEKAKEKGVLDEELRVEKERQEEASKVYRAEMFDEVQLAAERAEAIRNKPLTKSQLRNLMITYLKNMGGYKHSQLKVKSYKEIQGLNERQQKRIQDFTPMDSEKKAQKPGKRLKRVEGSYATQKSPKKPKVMKSAKDVTEEEAAEYKKE